jgi:hypothetical protein
MHGGWGEHDYRQLLDILRRHIDRESEVSNNMLPMDAIKHNEKPTKPEIPVNAAITPCRSGLECKSPKCKFKHPKGWKPGEGGKAQAPTKPDSKPHGKGKGKGEERAKTPPPNAADEKKTPRFKFNMGLCRKSYTECTFAHRKVFPEEQPAFDKYKAEVAVAKAAAKAKAKASPKA